MHSPYLGFQAKLAAVSVALLFLLLWLALHGYHGLTGDGQLYAFQAFAKLHPQFAGDLYLQNTSQDQFTLFSHVYARCIDVLGLEEAAQLLTLLFTVLFLGAAWNFVAAAIDRDTSWLAVAFLLVVAGDYGGSSVFRMLDPFLTARLPAEALIITALACHIRGMKLLSVLLALGALFLHPLMALPGMLFIVCLWLPIRLSVVGAIGGVLATLAIAVASIHTPTASSILAIMDAPWLDVVRERSQFLFLQLWSFHDWDVNALPFISLGFSALAIAEERIRKICISAALVGSAGLAVALLGGLIGPVAIVVQGQAWRWVWITVLVGAVMVPFTVFQAWREQRCGPLCALLLISGWTLPGVDGTVCVTLASLLWLIRTHVRSRLANHLRSVAVGLGLVIVAWIIVKYYAKATPPSLQSGHAPPAIVEGLLALRFPAVLLITLVWWAIRDGRRPRASALISAALAVFSIVVFPAALKQTQRLASSAQILEFADWANVIPPTGTVLVAPPPDVGAFVWFTLERPNYLALDQSAGVVFSRATALEVRRRSEVLRPLMDPNWKILTRLRAGFVKKETPRPLTAESLAQVCADPLLGFVISPEKVGFEPMRHEHAGAWKDWNLYDCRKVRPAPSAT